VRSIVLSLLLLSWIQAGWAEPFLEASLAPPDPWVQQQVRYRVRLYRDSHLQQGHFLAPEIPDVLVLEAGPPGELRRVVREGREMELLEQEWILFPQRSGRLELPPPVFSGRDFYLRGAPLQLDVKPRPPGSGDFPWLVTTRLEITELWSGPLEGLRPGEHRVRRIRLRALAQTGAQLPIPAMAPVKGFEIQPLPARLSWHFEEGVLWGERVHAFRYLATGEAGGELPPLVVRWWDPEQARVQEKRLPARPYRILPGEVPVVQAVPVEGREPGEGAEEEESAGLGLQLFLGAAGLVLLTVLLRYCRAGLVLWLSWLAAQVRLWSACRRGDCRRATRVLVEWRRLHGWPRMEPATRRAWEALDRACYGEGDGAWSGRLGWPGLRRLVALPARERNPGCAGAPLPPLWCSGKSPGNRALTRRRG